MELATTALSTLLPKLGSLLADEYKLQKGLRGEIKFLRSEMDLMHAALIDLSKLPEDQITEVDKLWARDLKELSYDIEDSVDEFVVRVDAPADPRRSKGFRNYIHRFYFVRVPKIRRQIAKDIVDIKVRIHDIADRRARYSLPDVAAQPGTTVLDPRLPALYQEVQKLVGIDGPADQLTNLLIQGDTVQKKMLMVVSIFGVGGLGKTTLANSLYTRLRYKEEFKCSAFVPVSQKPDIKKILSSILRQVISPEEYINAEAWGQTELTDKIREVLQKKRYIIVIDDIWDESAWLNIKCALFENNLGSRVIVTTRNASVARISCSPVDGAMHELQPLPFMDSKRLLFKRIFNEEEENHSELEEVSTKILKKCGGIPLAIITTASLLANLQDRTNKFEWYKVYYSMGSGLEKDKTMENMREILYLSYSDLPSYLKPCLLYLSMFPEDIVIPMDVLVPMWIAEGFVDGKQESSLYEIGEGYFNELVNRSIIHPVELNEQNYNRIGCRIHDMILDLIIYLAAQENFVAITEGAPVTSQVGKIRRLSAQGREKHNDGAQVMLPETVDVSHVRSLTVFHDDVLNWMPPLSKFSVLRVLCLKDYPSRNHPKDLGSLYHLRYLFLGGEPETELLEQIGNLKFLKILDLREAEIQELPASIAHLSELEHLFIMDGVKWISIENLVSLRELPWFDADESPSTLVELGNLIKLRVIRVRGLGLGDDENGVKTFLRSLSKLGNLRILKFDGRNKLCSLDLAPDQWSPPAHLRSIDGCDLTFCKLPRWFSALSELSSLTIEVKVLRQDDFHLLGALPVLSFLELTVHLDGTAEERLAICKSGPFRILKEFRFWHYTKCWLVVDQGAMPMLRRLQLYFQVQNRVVGGFDIGLENLTSLEHVDIGLGCDGAQIREVDDTKIMIKDAIDILPNHPSFSQREWRTV